MATVRIPYLDRPLAGARAPENASARSRKSRAGWLGLALALAITGCDLGDAPTLQVTLDAGGMEVSGDRFSAGERFVLMVENTTDLRAKCELHEVGDAEFDAVAEAIADHGPGGPTIRAGLPTMEPRSDLPLGPADFLDGLSAGTYALACFLLESADGGVTIAPLTLAPAP